MVSWILIEIISDRRLLARIRREIDSATFISDAGAILDIAQVLGLPLLNACYSECVRLRASVQVVRELRNDTKLDGYTLKAGNLIMAPSWLAHYGEAVWAVDGHPAHTFWAERYLEEGRPR